MHTNTCTHTCSILTALTVKGNPRNSKDKSGRGSYQKNKGGEANKRGTEREGDTRQQRSSNNNTSSHSSRFHRSGGRRGDTSSQPSNKSTGEPTRSAPLLNCTEKQNVGFPCIAVQPHAFRDSFSHTSNTGCEEDDEYSQPIPAVNHRWKFTDVPTSDTPPFPLGRDLLNWDREMFWPAWEDEHSKFAYTETVEDPFPTIPHANDCWDSDVGDMDISLTVDQDCMSLVQLPAFYSPAQCISESNYRNILSKESECVVQVVKLPK